MLQIPNISSFVKKTDYNTKLLKLKRNLLIIIIKTTEIEKKLTDRNHDKYITTPEFNALAADIFNARLAQANLMTKRDFDVKS